MFLDDKLYNHVVKRDIQSINDFQEMVNELFKICEDHFKPQLSAGMSYKEGKVIIDRTFNSWDLFINRLYKENYRFLDVMEGCSYKSAFMKNPELKRIYDLGKKSKS